MHFLDSPIPRISISPAPPEEPVREPYSPFQFLTPVLVENDGFRPVLLTPPPSVHCFKQLPSDSLLKPVRETDGIGLDGKRFQALLKATKERNASVGLRKELAIKIQKNKQAERRALFLSKVQSPPSPTAVCTPKTPPDSPAIFHYTLPSPGLDSPLAHFESVERDVCNGWVEQVDFNLMSEKRKSRPTLPSLEEISARLIPSSIKPSNYDNHIGASAPVPAFAIPRLSIDVGRLKLPLRAPQPRAETAVRQPSPDLKHEQKACPNTTNTTKKTKMLMMIPDATRCSSPDKLTETNLHAFDIRGQRAHDMLSTLRRRTTLSSNLAVQVDENKLRRYSAPADMTVRPRMGFEHAVLSMPGGF